MSYSRRQMIVATAGLAALVATSANAESANAQRRSSDMDMDIKRNGSRPSAKGLSGLVHRIGPRGSAVSGAGPGASGRWPGHLRTRRPHGVAHAPARPDADHHGRSGMGAARWRARRRSPSGRRGLVSAGLEALAWRVTDDGDDTYCRSGIAERQERRLAGKGERRTIPANLIPTEKPRPLSDHQDHVARREVLALEVN